MKCFSSTIVESFFRVWKINVSIALTSLVVGILFALNFICIFTLHVPKEVGTIVGDSDGGKLNAFFTVGSAVGDFLMSRVG